MFNSNIYKLTNSRIVLFIILYYSIGSYIFSGYYVNNDYITKFISIFFNENLNLIFILPSFILMTSYIYKQFYSENFVIRFASRKRYLNYLLINTFKVNTILYLLLLLITFVMCNLTIHQGFSIVEMKYSDNLIFMLCGILKMWIWLMLFSFIVLGFYLIIKKSSIANIINIIFISIIYFSKYILGSFLSFRYLFAITYIIDKENCFNSMLINNICSLIYFIFIFILIQIVLKKYINKKEFLMEGVDNND